jgi:YbgC/YbaW family acyl-CoA thioester hydrolase
MKRAEFRHLEPLRVRWAEVDLQKIVFNGHYLMYVDTAVAGYWRALALPYHDTMEQLEGDLYVRKATLEYEGSARYDERLEVGIRCTRIGNSSMVFSAGVFRGEQRLVHGELVYVFADPRTQTSRPVPPALREWLLAFEAGEPMVQVQMGDWNAAREPAMALRHAVFAREQGIDAALMSDEADARALHAVAHNRAGRAVGSGRLVCLNGLDRLEGASQGVGKIGRMAVDATVRGAGVGAQLLRTLVQAGRERGLTELVLHAQLSARAFYARAGWQPLGEVFEEAGVPHQTMRLALAQPGPAG